MADFDPSLRGLLPFRCEPARPAIALRSAPQAEAIEGSGQAHVAPRDTGQETEKTEGRPIPHADWALL